MSESRSIDWYDMYQSMKKKYNQLYQVRCECLRMDINVIKERIEEHENDRKETIEDILDHREHMTAALQNIQGYKAHIEAMKNNIRRMKLKMLPFGGLFLCLVCHLYKTC